MASTGNRILELVSLISSYGVEVNIGKNKAQGNKGFFKAKGDKYRIDINKNVSDEEVLRVLVHEFAHFLHYTYCKKMNNLEFILKDKEAEFLEELIELTVSLVPSEMPKKLFAQKDEIKNLIKPLVANIKSIYPDFFVSKPYKKIENSIKNRYAKMLLKYDAVKVVDFFEQKVYHIQELDKCFPELTQIQKTYILLKSKQRMLSRVNSRISKINRYYNSCTELFARSIELYMFNREQFEKMAPNLIDMYDNYFKTSDGAVFLEILKIVKK